MNGPIKLYLDEDTSNRSLIRALRYRSVDLLTAREAGLISAPDERHLEFAASVNRAVFTFNSRDFVILHTKYLEDGKHHAGIIVSNQLQVGFLLKRLLKLLNARSAKEMRDWLEYLSNWQ